MKKRGTNVTMLTEEQIQRLAKKLVDKHDDDEEECKEYVRFMLNGSEDKKDFEGEFFEDLLERCFLVGKRISKICRLIINKGNSVA